MTVVNRPILACFLAVMAAMAPPYASAQPYGQNRGIVPLAADLAPPAAEPAPSPPKSSQKRYSGNYWRPKAAIPVVNPVQPVQVRPGALLTPDQALPPLALQSFVDGYVRRSLETDHIAGAVVIVVQNGQVVMKKGYGLSQASPARAVDPDQTLFRLASISKTLTWIALMQQVEAGKLRLDAPVNTYLPEALQIPDNGFSRPIKVRDLMAHTTGFEDRALGQLFEQDPGRVRGLATYLRQERPKRVREAGTFPTYSNYGAALAGEIVVHLTGQTFEQYVERQITGKLGLNHLTLREPYPQTDGLPAPMSPALARQISKGFVWTGDRFETRPFEYVSQLAPAGSGSATAADMGRYMQMILNGGSLDGAIIYGPATAKAFQTPLIRPAYGQNSWNHGFIDYALPGGFHGQGHAGATLMFMSNMVTVPQLGLGVFVATNTGTGEDLVRALPGQIIGQFYASPVKTQLSGSAQLVGQGHVYNGTYRSTRRAFSGLEKLVETVSGESKVAVSPDGQVIIKSRNGEKAYRLSEKPGWLSRLNDPEQVRFDRVGDQAVRYYDPSGTDASERIGFWQSNAGLGLMAGLTVLATLFLFVGQFTNRRPDYRQTRSQSQAHVLQACASGLWVAAICLFGAWAVSASDVTRIFFDWPSLKMTLASSCALLAALFTLATLGLSPAVWRGGRRQDSWSTGRKLRFTATLLIFAIFALLLALRGGLEPWSA